tara:strand:- start:528 stop:1790 length:1263 start_codon:yes stop_codon:yes gene_type:complete
MAVFKNVASQKLAVFAWDTSADTEKTGDAGNITAQISLDGGATAATNDTNPTELDATDAPGVYLFDLTQAETNADLVILAAKSSTSNIKLEPVIVYTVAVGAGNRVAVDAEAISGVTTAADNVEANIGNLDAAVSSRSSFDATSDTVDVGKISGSAAAADDVEAKIGNLDAAISTRSTFDSTTDTVDVGKISGSASAADDVEAKIANLDAAVSTRSTFDSTTDTVDVGKISGSATAADNVEANISNLDATVSTRSTFDATTDTVDVGKISGSAAAADDVEAKIGNLDAAVSTRSTFDSTSDTVDVGKVSGSATAADDIEANISNLDAAVSTRSTVTTAQVNTEVVDAITVDTISELAQDAPPATPTLAEAVMALYMGLRNKLTVTSTEKKIHNDAGTAIFKKTLSDNGSTYEETEAVSGP